MTLLTETKQAIKNSGHTPKDILFIGSEQTGHSCSWAEFQELAKVEYDGGFGAAAVGTDLIVAFTDGAKMWRGEYDGSEWWEYSTPFKMPAKLKPIKRLVGYYWPSLEDLQNDKDTHHNPALLTAPAKEGVEVNE